MEVPPPRQTWTGVYPLRVRVGGGEHHIITSSRASARLAAPSGSQGASQEWALLSRSGGRTPLHPESHTGRRCLSSSSDGVGSLHLLNVEVTCCFSEGDVLSGKLYSVRWRLLLATSSQPWAVSNANTQTHTHTNLLIFLPLETFLIIKAH